MRLSHEEDIFLRHWMYDEMHYEQGTGPAKRLQVEHGAAPADLAVIIAAAVPDLAEQWAAGTGPAPAAPPVWPWSDSAFRARVAEANTILAVRTTSPGRPRPAPRPSRPAAETS
jgi:hypothetical protein